MINSNLKIVCPSRSRADNLLTKKLFTGFKLIVVVPNRQLPEYRFKNTEECLEFVGHPDYIKGIAAVRWWIMRKMGDVFMIDDDIDHVRGFSGQSTFETIKNPEYINDIIHNCYLHSKQIGAKMFGFANLKHQEYKTQYPFDNKGYIPSKSFGFCSNHGLSFDQKKTWVSGVDGYYYSLMNLHINKYSHIDNRYCFHNMKGGKGGINDYRKSIDEPVQTAGLLGLFGRSIHPNKKAKGSRYKLIL